MAQRPAGCPVKYIIVEAESSKSVTKTKKECGWYNKNELPCYSGCGIKDVVNA